MIEPSLVTAAAAGDLRALKRGMTSTSPAAAEKNDALVAAAAEGHLRAVRYLEQNGVDLVASGAAALRAAAAGRHGKMVTYLHSKGAQSSLLGPKSRARIADMQAELRAADEVYHPSRFWEFFSDVDNTLLAWGGVENFKRTINQNYFNFIPSSLFDSRMTQLWRLWRFRASGYRIEDPDFDPANWFSWDKRYQVFKGRFRFRVALYKWFIAGLYEYALTTDREGVLAGLEEPELGNPINVRRKGRLVSQDLVNSVRERNTLVSVFPLARMQRPPVVAELGAGYGRLGHVLLASTPCRYMVFDIPPALYVSEWYLSRLLPERRIFPFRGFRSYAEIAEELERADIAFFTSNQLEMFPDAFFDAFVTVSSLHEMRRAQIEHFVRLMTAKTRHAIYLKQHTSYENPYDGLRITRSVYVIPPDWRIALERPDEINPGFFELVALRTPDADASGNRVSSVMDARRPTVSILLANYNHAKYLPESLGAICTQTMRPDEVVVVDDGSTDKSVDVIDEFARKYPFVTVLRHHANQGLIPSITEALERAKGDYIVWAAADDRLLPQFLERSVAALAEHRGAGVCFSQLAALEDGTNVVRVYDSEAGRAFDLGERPHFLTPGELKARLETSYLWMSGNTVLARRDAVLAAGGFRRDLEWHAEWFVFYVVALRYGACVVPETLALLREMRGTYSRTGMEDRRRQRAVLRALAGTIASQPYRDVAPVFHDRPVLLSPFGTTMLPALIKTRGCRDLAWRYFRWLANHWSGIYRARARSLVRRVRRRARAQRLVRRLSRPWWK